MTDRPLPTINLDHIAIVVVEPRGEINLGAIARVMKNMGLGNLILVNPQCDYLSVDARNMAVHAKNILETVTVVPTLGQALDDRQRVIATTARQRVLQSPLETPRQVLPWLLESPVKSALVFGREASGLTNEELNQAHRFLRIPVHPQYESLNLAQAVAVCVYELYQASLASSTVNPIPIQAVIEKEPVDLANSAQLNAYYQHLEKTLLDIQVLYPHTAASRMAKFRRLYQRAQLNSEEVALLRGILGKVDWLVQQMDKENSHRHQPPG